MRNINQLFENMKIRESMLTPSLKNLKSDLESEYEKQKNAGGVIMPGHFSYLSSILERAKSNRIINEFLITQEEYVSNGNLIKIPVVDVNVDYNNYRIFVISKEYARDVKIDEVIK